jgi:heat shock protein HtpX
MAVLAHELGHVRNRDILVGTIAATLAGAISMLANMFMWTSMMGGRSNEREGSAFGVIGAVLAMIYAPMAAALIQMAISRSRDYGADEASARLMGSGRPLANALRKLHNGNAYLAMQGQEARVEPATAHMFIVNPLSGQGFAGLFSTHPPVEERIARLEAM